MAKRIIIFFTIGLLLPSCLFDTCDFVDAYPISDGLYLERYRTFNAGVWGEATTCYLTDSISFRQRIGSYDEHSSFYVKRLNDKIFTYNLEWHRIPVILEKRTLSKKDLLSYHHTGEQILTTTPLFGKNKIKCDTNIHSLSGWKTDEGPWWSELQFKCGPDDFEDAVYYTDSSTFCLLIGVCKPGCDRYRVKVNKNDTFEFQSVDWRDRTDTVSSRTYLLSDLKENKFAKVCENWRQSK